MARIAKASRDIWKSWTFTMINPLAIGA